MSCHYDPTPEEQQAYNAMVAEATKTWAEKVDALTDMLCEVMTALGTSYRGDTVGDVLDNLDPRLEDWWEDHQKADAARKAALKEQAAAKLTPDEREALGLPRGDA